MPVVESALREISDDIEKGDCDTHPVKTTNKSLIYKCNKMSVTNADDLNFFLGF